MATKYYEIHEFRTKELLVERLKEKIVAELQEAITNKGYATLALSGGSTPKKLFQELSKVPLEWERVYVTLVDERWVDVNSDASNEKLVRENLLINAAVQASFAPLKTAHSSAKEAVSELCQSMKKLFSELDIVILGMGLDAHTASFFPKAQELEHALSTQELVCATTASVEPKERITLSRKFLLSSKNLILHIEGREKKEVFEDATASDEVASKPIIAMMQQEHPLLEVYYAE
ncbi:MAG: 6-phosphogluconolactonase [Campylobacterales bacterium]|nr:6-phosphogluconolactonase [Campylobacterales bacterium]